MKKCNCKYIIKYFGLAWDFEKKIGLYLLNFTFINLF